MVKSVNVRLDPEKDKDILDMIEHSKISNVQLFKSLARVAVSNTDVTRLGIFDDDYENVTENNKTVQNDTKHDTRHVTESNKKVSNDNKKEQNVTQENNEKQNDTKASQNVTKSNSKPKEEKEDSDPVDDLINSRFSNIQK